MNGFCNTPGHQDRPARLYPCGWRCEGCAPGRKERSSVNAETGNDEEGAAR